jgi:hypothetical protein
MCNFGFYKFIETVNKLQKERKFTEIKKGNDGTLEKAVFIIDIKSIDL